MHDNDIPAPLTEAQERTWFALLDELQGAQRKGRFLSWWERRRNIVAVGATVSVLAGAIAAAALAPGGESRPEIPYSPIQELVLKNPVHLGRLGLCESVLQDAAQVFSAQGEQARARRLETAAAFAAVSEIGCTASSEEVALIVGGEEMHVTRVELVGSRPAPSPLLASTPAPTPS